jgi:hypothetical protein
MSDLVCTHVRRSRFIDRDIVFDIKREDHMPEWERSISLRKEMKDLGMAFFRNRVELRFTIPRESKSDEFRQIRERVKEFCDSKLTGHWTWKISNRNIDGMTRSLELDLMFEKEDELELFLKDHGTIVRLTY